MKVNYSNMTTADGTPIDECRFFAQCDWLSSLSQAPYKLYVGIQRPGEKSPKFYDAVIEPSTGLVEIPRANGEICAKLRGRVLEVAVPNGNSAKFLAPITEYSGIHKGAVQTVDVTSSGSMLLSSDFTGKLRVSCVADGRLLRELDGHVSSLSAARFFPSNLVVLAGGVDMQLRVWSVESGDVARCMRGHTMSITDVGIIGIGKEVVSSSRDGTAKKWLCATGECLLTWAPEAGEVSSLALSSDFTKIALGCSLGALVVYPIDSTEPLLRIDLREEVTALCFSPDGSQIFCGYGKNTFGIYSAKDGAIENDCTSTRGNIERCVWCDMGIIAAFHDGTVAIFDPVKSLTSSWMELSGSDCDPVYDLAVNDRIIFTASRDHIIRKFAVPQL